MNVRKTLTTSALALGVLAGSAGVASAWSSSSSTPQQAPPPTADDQIEEPTLDGSIQADQVEGQSEADESAALASQATVTADDATQAVVTANPGATVSDVQLENENGTVVYEVKMTDASGAVVEAKVDAGNGTILAQDSGADNEADEGAEGPENEADEGAEAETDGVDHEFEGQETGNNGDGIPDAGDANEAPEVAPAN